MMNDLTTIKLKNNEEAGIVIDVDNNAYENNVKDPPCKHVVICEELVAEQITGSCPATESQKNSTTETINPSDCLATNPFIRNGRFKVQQHTTESDSNQDHSTEGSTLDKVNVSPKKCEYINVMLDQKNGGNGNLAATIDTIQLLGTPNATHQLSCMEEENMKKRLRLSLLKQCSAILKQGEEKYSKESLRKIFQDQDLNERIFRLFDVDRKGYLVQEDWIEFLKQRLKDEKGIELVEELESQVYDLCGEEAITSCTFHQLLQGKGVAEKILRVLDSDGDTLVTADEIMDFLAAITNSSRRKSFDKTNVEWLEKLFRQTVGDGKEIKREDFHKIVASKNPFFTERAFQIFDEDDSGSISLQEFIDTIHKFAGQTPENKIRFLFKVYDLDGDGLIQHRELQHVLRACMEENGMKFSEEQLQDLTLAMFEDADTENRGAITYEALKNQLSKHGGLLENLSISIDRWLVPPKPKEQPKSLKHKVNSMRPYQLTKPYIKNNYVYLIFLGAFLVLNAGLFISRGIEYRNYNIFVIIARACGQCLNFNCMWILVLMLRQCITFLRTRGFGSIFPLDHHMYLHKLTGLIIFVLSFIHTIMHLCNFSIMVVKDPVINKQNFTIGEWLLTEKPGVYGLVPGYANPTGIALAVILCVMFVCSQPFIRRGGSFEIFYWTHLLYVPFWILLIFHGPNFWKWFVVPGFIYIVERIIRLKSMRSESGKTYISSGILLPSRVIHLVIKRPVHFDFHPGDYVFINIPAIAKYEWHPFTISSAPEEEDYIWLHIRAVGEWTNRLYAYFDRKQQKLHEGELPIQLVGSLERALSNNIEALLHTSDISSNTNYSALNTGFMETETSIPEDDNASESSVLPDRRDNDTFELRRTQPNIKASARMNFSDITDATTTRMRRRLQDIQNETAVLDIPDIDSASTTTSTPMPIKTDLPTSSKPTRLEKSLSVPAMEPKQLKINVNETYSIRDYKRSESFNTPKHPVALASALSEAYKSPQNRSLAQSFKYMRTKPTIIAFKTPSYEEEASRRSSTPIIPAVRRRISQTLEAYLTDPSASPRDNLELCTVSSRRDSESTARRQSGSCSVERPLEIFLEGPYGAPSSHIFRAQHAVLIATGIGVTPFASILKSIMHRYWKARHTCPRCEHTWASEIPPTVMHLRKVDFFWINREQRSFEWFVSLLSQLEIEQAELGAAMERFLEMHMYITSALQRTDMKAVGLQLALDLLHKKEKRDLITGLKTRTIAGRPNWDKVFKQIEDQKKGKVTVFYCGPPQLARLLRVKCDQFNFEFRKEIF